MSLSENTKLIEVRHLTHIYMPGSPFETKALDDVSLTIEKGDFFGIIGHTGSGKSTLIAYMNGLEKSGAGHVFAWGEDLADKRVRMSELRRKIGLVFQYPEYQLFEETVEKDIAFGLKHLKLTEAETRERVREAMRLVGLEERHAAESPFNLSGGQKRRAAIAGVLAMRPEVLIMDEPAAGLDPAGRREILEMLRRIHDAGLTVVMVSHSMDDVGRYCNRLAVLSGGRVVYTGTPAEVFAHGEELRMIGLDVPVCVTVFNRLWEMGAELDGTAFTPEEACEIIMKAAGKRGDRDGH